MDHSDGQGNKSHLNENWGIIAWMTMIVSETSGHFVSDTDQRVYNGKMMDHYHVIETIKSLWCIHQERGTRYNAP